MNVSTRLAATVGAGDVIGYEGQWRTVKAISAVTLPTGGLAVVFAWEEGGSTRFSAGDLLFVDGAPKP